MDEALMIAAGEYALGTLDEEEKRAFLARLASETEAAEALAFWRTRLAPLAATAVEVVPPAYIWPRIEARVGANDNVPAAEGVSGWWRIGTLAASAAALMMGVIALRPDPAPVAPPPAPIVAAPQPAAGPAYVSAVTAEGAEPALLVTLDPRTGKAVIRAIGLTPPQRKSLELWYIGKDQAPESLGLVAGDGAIEVMLRDAIQRGDPMEAGVFAVTLEPEGGGPGGKPTGPILYSGKIMGVGI
jgi:anti-sigma-K factor RskA